MLVLAAFVAIGVVAVAFLVRFLVALEADARQPPVFQPYAMSRHYLHVATAVSRPANGLILAHRNAKLSAHRVPGLRPKLVAVETLADDKRELASRRRSERARLGTS